MTDNIYNQFKSAEDAKLEAQKIAFCPIAFQAAKILRDRGILKTVEESRDYFKRTFQ